MDLSQYEQRKFAIAELLRTASTSLPEAQNELRGRIQELFARLAEDRFNLAVVGRFNRGKTSLINALLGTDRLPTGIVPLTSVITALGYGSKERVVLKFRNSLLNREIPIDDLQRHITQQCNPGNVQQIVEAEIQLPAEILRRGFYFVDTPGLGSAVTENTLTTQAFLPQADAFILVTGYDSPLSEEEYRFVGAAATTEKRIFVVLNKHDTVSANQRGTVLHFVRDRLHAAFGNETPPVFSVSCTNGLNARLSGDEAGLGASGIAELEAALVAFLLKEKNDRFLAGMCERVQALLRELPATRQTESLIAQAGAVRHQHPSSIPLTAPTGRFPDLHRLPACEICARIADELWKFMCQLQHEIVVSSEQRNQLANGCGLCPFHAWQLHTVESPYGVCVGYPPLLDRLRARLDDLASRTLSSAMRKGVETLIPDENACALCKVRADAEGAAIAVTACRLNAAGQPALNALSSICLPHLVPLVGAIPNDDLVRSMLRRHATILGRYAEDMRRYAVKHDGLSRHLASREEATVAERGLLLLSGQRQVNFRPGHGAGQGGTT